MAREKKDLNLYRSYRRVSRPKANFSLLHTYYTPVVLLMVVGLIAWGVLLRMNLDLMDRIDQVNAWLEDPATVEDYQQAVAKDAYNELLLRDIREVRELEESLDAYPQVGSALLAEIGAVGGDEVAITGYDALTGALLFEARSRAVIDIPGYVLALQNTGLFHTVRYTGYAYDEGLYVLRLNCVLQPGVGREGGAP